MMEERTLTIPLEVIVPPPPVTFWERLMSWWGLLTATQKALMIFGVFASGTGVVVLAKRGRVKVE